MKTGRKKILFVVVISIVCLAVLSSVSFFHFVKTKSGMRIIPKKKVSFKATVVDIQTIIDDYNIHYTNKSDIDNYLRQNYLTHELFRRGYVRVQTVFSEKEGTVILEMYEKNR